jgi:hypothetical protein
LLAHHRDGGILSGQCLSAPHVPPLGPAPDCRPCPRRSRTEARAPLASLRRSSPPGRARSCLAHCALIGGRTRREESRDEIRRSYARPSPRSSAPRSPRSAARRGAERGRDRPTLSRKACASPHSPGRDIQPLLQDLQPARNFQLERLLPPGGRRLGLIAVSDELPVVHEGALIGYVVCRPLRPHVLPLSLLGAPAERASSCHQ